MNMSKKQKKTRALAMFSGGLDSIVAARLMQAQGIDVYGVKFNTRFFSRKENDDIAGRMAAKISMPLEQIDISQEYLDILQNPRHGYGVGINPCIDCKILMLKKAKEYADKINADFIFTGEVLGERPKSQHKAALGTIEKEAGLKGKLLRPLSAKLLAETEPEKKGLVSREKLLDIEGRGRDRQIELAKVFGIKDYPGPAGGCLLAEAHFGRKGKDIIQNKKKLAVSDIEILKWGRHFRVGKNKIIVGRNENENTELLRLKSDKDYFFQVRFTGSPVTVLQGSKTAKGVKAAAELTAAYSDSDASQVKVSYGTKELCEIIIVDFKGKDSFLEYMV